MISPKKNMECLARLGMLKFSPTRETVIAEVGKLLNKLCMNDEEAQILVDVMLVRFTEWPGPAGIREVHAAEVVSRRPRPKGCGLCDEDGYRWALTILEDLGGGSFRRHLIFRDGQTEADQTRDIRGRFAGPKYKDLGWREVLCDCPLGIYRNACKSAAQQYFPYRPPSTHPDITL